MILIGCRCVILSGGRALLEWFLCYEFLRFVGCGFLCMVDFVCKPWL